MIGDALCLGIGGLGKVVLGGTGVGGDDIFGVLNVYGIRVGGDVAIGGKNGLQFCMISRICSCRVVSAIKGLVLNIISKLSSSSSAWSNSSIVKSTCCNGCCGDSDRARSPDPVGTSGSDPSGGNNIA